MKTSLHRHHLIPKHMGGLDVESNLTPPISIEMHAEFHRLLWLDYGNKNDYIAWQALSGRVSGESARLAAAKIGQDVSVLYKEGRSAIGHRLRMFTSKEDCSKGGKTASKALVRWQRENAEKFLEIVRKNGASSAPRLHIPHEYLGVVYESKKALQEKTKISNCGFYGKLKRGEIKRLGKKRGAK